MTAAQLASEKQFIDLLFVAGLCAWGLIGALMLFEAYHK